jgi:hypothetical protein
VCNNKKRALAAEDPDAQIAHVYLDTFPVEQFLVARVDVSQNGLRVDFSVQRCPGMSAELFNRLTFQFSRFALNRRYQAEVNTFVSSLRLSIEEAAVNGANALRSFLERSRDSLQTEFGANDWRPALMNGLAQSNDFCGGGFKHCFGVRNVAI